MKMNVQEHSATPVCASATCVVKILRPPAPWAATLIAMNATNVLLIPIVVLSVKEVEAALTVSVAHQGLILVLQAPSATTIRPVAIFVEVILIAQLEKLVAAMASSATKLIAHPWTSQFASLWKLVAARDATGKAKAETKLVWTVRPRMIVRETNAIEWRLIK